MDLREILGQRTVDLAHLAGLVRRYPNQSEVGTLKAEVADLLRSYGDREGAEAWLKATDYLAQTFLAVERGRLWLARFREIYDTHERVRNGLEPEVVEGTEIRTPVDALNLVNRMVLRVVVHETLVAESRYDNPRPYRLEAEFERGVVGVRVVSNLETEDAWLEVREGSGKWDRFPTEKAGDSDALEWVAWAVCPDF